MCTALLSLYTTVSRHRVSAAACHTCLLPSLAKLAGEMRALVPSMEAEVRAVAAAMEAAYGSGGNGQGNGASMVSGSEVVTRS